MQQRCSKSVLLFSPPISLPLQTLTMNFRITLMYKPIHVWDASQKFMKSLLVG